MHRWRRREIFLFSEKWTVDLVDDYGDIYLNNLSSNCEYIWNIYSNDSSEFQVIIHDIDLNFEQDYLQIITGNCSLNFIDVKCISPR